MFRRSMHLGGGAWASEVPDYHISPPTPMQATNSTEATKRHVAAFARGSSTHIDAMATDPWTPMMPSGCEEYPVVSIPPGRESTVDNCECHSSTAVHNNSNFTKSQNNNISINSQTITDTLPTDEHLEGDYDVDRSLTGELVNTRASDKTRRGQGKTECNINATTQLATVAPLLQTVGYSDSESSSPVGGSMTGACPTKRRARSQLPPRHIGANTATWQQQQISSVLGTAGRTSSPCQSHSPSRHMCKHHSQNHRHKHHPHLDHCQHQPQLQYEQTQSHEKHQRHTRASSTKCDPIVTPKETFPCAPDTLVDCQLRSEVFQQSNTDTLVQGLVNSIATTSSGCVASLFPAKTTNAKPRRLHFVFRLPVMARDAELLRSETERLLSRLATCDGSCGKISFSSASNNCAHSALGTRSSATHTSLPSSSCSSASYDSSPTLSASANRTSVASFTTDDCQSCIPHPAGVYITCVDKYRFFCRFDDSHSNEKYQQHQPRINQLTQGDDRKTRIDSTTGDNSSKNKYGIDLITSFDNIESEPGGNEPEAEVSAQSFESPSSVAFDVEVVRLAKPRAYGVRFKRRAGSAKRFKRIAEALAGQLPFNSHVGTEQDIDVFNYNFGNWTIRKSIHERFLEPRTSNSDSPLSSYPNTSRPNDFILVLDTSSICGPGLPFYLDQKYSATFENTLIVPLHFRFPA
ncbi:unnamed protein product [Protopolystoma xenopodis]|uniref:non-specific serine/threonine protein kinase n=1 Tax=Protopolystoma xenopodis TaxID=117903 RepID=A0A448XCN1_9PLAT|nr:unnamed protein product [Protopolystoma xenopodis]